MSKRQWSLFVVLLLINWIILTQLYDRISRTPSTEAVVTSTPIPTFTPTPFIATATPTITPTPTPLPPTPTNTPVLRTPEPPTPTPNPAEQNQDSQPAEANQPPANDGQARVTANSTTVNLRAGPGTNYARVGSLGAGQTLIIIGRNANSTWWQVSTANGPAWIAASVTTASNTGNVPVAQAPAAPVAAPTNTPVPAQPTQPPAPQTQYSLHNVFGQLNEAITQIRGEVRDAAGNPVMGARIRVRSGSFCTVSYPSGAPGGYPGGNYDILLDSRAKPGSWLIAVVNGPSDPKDTSCSDGLAMLSEEITVNTQQKESVIYVEWRKNY